MNLRSTLIRADSPEDVAAAIIELDAASVIADVEPLACMWGSDDRALLDGTATVLHALERAPSLVEVVFVTNSRRVPSVALEHAPLRVGYCSHAGKPWIDLAQFRALPRPLVVVGDQLLTDGLLAWRLDAPFIRLELPPGAPLGVRLQSALGSIVGRMFFRRPSTCRA